MLNVFDEIIKVMGGLLTDKKTGYYEVRGMRGVANEFIEKLHQANVVSDGTIYDKNQTSTDVVASVWFNTAFSTVSSYASSFASSLSGIVPDFTDKQLTKFKAEAAAQKNQ